MDLGQPPTRYTISGNEAAGSSVVPPYSGAALDGQGSGSTAHMTICRAEQTTVGGTGEQERRLTAPTCIYAFFGSSLPVSPSRFVIGGLPKSRVAACF